VSASVDAFFTEYAIDHQLSPAYTNCMLTPAMEPITHRSSSFETPTARTALRVLGMNHGSLQF
jgi:hypothetical protein